MKKLLLGISLMLLVGGCTQPLAYQALTSTNGHLSSNETIDHIDDEIVAITNQFAFDLLHTLFIDDDNIIISPLSVQLALGMTFAGASGNTLAQFNEMMNITTDDLHTMQKQLQLHLTNRSKAILNINNSLWIRDEYQPLVYEDFLDTVIEHYGALIAAGDFNDSAMVDSINRWVKDTTNNKIDKAVEGPIDPLTVMFLINTIYLNADWKSPFIKQDNVMAPFYGVTTENITFMNQTLTTRAILDQGRIYLELDYEDEDLMMVLIIDGDAPTTFETYQELKSKATNQSIDLFMPKFKLEYEASLNTPLKDMGISDAFIPYTADFSKMAQDAQTMGLHIADVLHKTFIQVDEKGTEAAAMTKVEMRLESAPIRDLTIKFDKSFTMLLVDKREDVILFSGFVQNLDE